MMSNDVLKKIRFIFDFNDSSMIALFGLGELEVTREQISSWLKSDDDPDFKEIKDIELAVFLNGLINAVGHTQNPQIFRIIRSPLSKRLNMINIQSHRGAALLAGFQFVLTNFVPDHDFSPYLRRNWTSFAEFILDGETSAARLVGLFGDLFAGERPLTVGVWYWLREG